MHASFAGYRTPILMRYPSRIASIGLCLFLNCGPTSPPKLTLSLKLNGLMDIAGSPQTLHVASSRDSSLRHIEGDATQKEDIFDYEGNPDYTVSVQTTEESPGAIGKLTLDVSLWDDKCPIAMANKTTGLITDTEAASRSILMTLKPCTECWCEYSFDTEGLVAGPARTLATGASENDVWAIGKTGYFLHWNGAEWSFKRVGTSSSINDLTYDKDKKVWWAVGGSSATGGDGVIARLRPKDSSEESAWEVFPPIHGSSKLYLRGLFVDHGGTIWVVGNTTDNIAYMAQASAQLTANIKLEQVSVAAIEPKLTSLNGIHGANPGNTLWAVGGIAPQVSGIDRCSFAQKAIRQGAGRILMSQDQGKTWTLAPMSPETSAALYPVWDIYASTDSDAWGVGECGTIVRWNGTEWKLDGQGLTDRSLWQIKAVDADSIWVAGGSLNSSTTGFGVLLHWQGGRWSHEPKVDPALGYPKILESRYLFDITSNDQSSAIEELWADGQFGTSDDTAMLRYRAAKNAPLPTNPPHP